MFYESPPWGSQTSHAVIWWQMYVWIYKIVLWLQLKKEKQKPPKLYNDKRPLTVGILFRITFK